MSDFRRQIMKLIHLNFHECSASREFPLLKGVPRNGRGIYDKIKARIPKKSVFLCVSAPLREITIA